ncbi:MAG TPA: VanW family protein [Mycobacteriales bacterium]|nr:VanW family protein [Mycobacteriales bacterium]
MTTTRRRVLAGVLGTLGLLAVLYAADVALASGKVPRGTTVDGVAIGGKSRAEAERLVAARVRVPGAVTVTLPDGADPLWLDPAKVGLRLDARATVDKARAESLNPVARIGGLFGHRTIEPVTAVDEARLRDAVAAWKKKVDRNAREGAIRFDGVTPVPVLPLEGRSVDVDKTAAAVAAAFPKTDTVAATVATTPVRTTAGAVTQALEQVAEPAVAAPVMLAAPAKSATMTRAQIAKVLTFVPGPDGTLQPYLDAKRVGAVLADTLKPVETPPKDAPVTVDAAGKVTIGASVNGVTVDRDALTAALLPVLADPAPRRVTLVVETALPRLTTEKAKTLGIKEKVSEFTTYHPCCRPRVQNIHTIADIVKGAVVLPGETFSLNGYVGERDRGRGFVEAPMILNGRFVPAVGGGVSQFATTMFNAVFFGGFEDVYHKPHSYYISRYPAGREATVSTPAPDLKWRNDSPYGVLVTTSYTAKSITVTFWSTKRYDIESVSGPRTRVRGYTTQYDSSPTCESSSGEPGFDIDVWRVFKQGGKEIRRQRFHTRYLPEPRFVCRR